MPQDQKGRYYEDEEARSDAAVASAARTSSGTSTAFNTESATALEGTVTVSASSGTTPTLDLSLQTTVDGTNYYTVGSFAQITGTGSQARAFGPLGDKCRWSWTIGGTTPSFTFSVAVTAQREH